MQTVALNTLMHTRETLDRSEGKRAAMALTLVKYVPARLECSDTRLAKPHKFSLLTLICDMKDAALMLLGRDDDDQDYECAHG